MKRCISIYFPTKDLASLRKARFCEEDEMGKVFEGICGDGGEKMRVERI